jgi:hypothetical protein
MGTKSLLLMLFLIYSFSAIYLGFSESTYSLKKMALDIQSTMILIAIVFYKEDE